MTHYILSKGRFERACAEFLENVAALPYVDLHSDENARKKKAASKTKFTCLLCGANAWGKPDLQVICAPCERLMLSEANAHPAATEGIAIST